MQRRQSEEAMATAQQKVGLFGGTFDPIHFGHLNLAVEMMEHHNLDEVWFCPARSNPHKEEEEAVSVEQRLEMASLAIEGVPQFRLLDAEARRPGPSYTVDTVRQLFEQERRRQFPRQILLILGDDSIERLTDWMSIQEIVDSVELLVGRRAGELALKNPMLSFKMRDAILRGSTETRVMQISSTEVRDRLQRGLYCGHLVPAKVLDYIHEHHLYGSL